MGTAVAATARTRIRRQPDKAVNDFRAVRAVLDAGLVAHVGVVDGDQPYVLPLAYGRDGERLLLHGSTGSRLFRALAAGVQACVTVTVLDGVVFARSVFNSSMNYRCVMVLGRGSTVAEADKEAALKIIANHVMPGRWPDARPPNRQELAATIVVALPLEEVSLKVSAGPPEDEADDLNWPAWAGVLPLLHVPAPPLPANGYPTPDYVTAWRR